MIDRTRHVIAIILTVALMASLSGCSLMETTGSETAGTTPEPREVELFYEYFPLDIARR